MEHIVQFGIGIDDEAISKRVMDNAEKQIVNEIKLAILNDLFEFRHGYGKPARIECGNVSLDRCASLTDFSREIISELVSEFKQEIIDCAAKELAESYKRTKAWKELVGSSLIEGG